MTKSCPILCNILKIYMYLISLKFGTYFLMLISQCQEITPRKAMIFYLKCKIFFDFFVCDLKHYYFNSQVSTRVSKAV